jgi:hypothetical protein
MAIPAYCLDSTKGLLFVVVADGAADNNRDSDEEWF